jgi:hypothetical protein
MLAPMAGHSGFSVVKSPPIDRIAFNHSPPMEAPRTVPTGCGMRAALRGGPLLAILLLSFAPPAAAEASRAIAMHGAPALPDDFQALPMSMRTHPRAAG